jgi:hypothetical protein
MSLIIHIVPQLPPAICGVGDYATLVGRKLEELWPDVRCGYVACGYRAAEQPADGQGRRDATGCREASRMWSAVGELVDELAGPAVDRVSLAVHCSGYGYHPDGAPGWLAEALERRPPQFSDIGIVAMFHELYATGWPWQKAFFTSSRQRAIAIRIARLSSALMTNRQESARWLEEMTGRSAGSVVNLPVPSNVGEPETVPPWDQRSPRALAFGGVRNKGLVLGASAVVTAKALELCGITELVDVGPRAPVDRAVFDARGIRVQQLGYCDRDRVSDLLLQSRIGFIDCPFDFLTKSSVLAAYAAHGLAIFNAARRKRRRDDLVPAFSSDRLTIRTLPNAVELASAAKRARDWYLQHRAVDHARTISRFVS